MGGVSKSGCTCVCLLWSTSRPPRGTTRCKWNLARKQKDGQMDAWDLGACDPVSVAGLDSVVGWFVVCCTGCEVSVNRLDSVVGCFLVSCTCCEVSVARLDSVVCCFLVSFTGCEVSVARLDSVVCCFLSFTGCSHFQALIFIFYLLIVLTYLTFLLTP